MSEGKRYTRWTPRDIDFLHQHYTAKGAAWCAERLGRSAIACHKCARREGAAKWRGKRSMWTVHEEAFLRAHYQTKGAAWCAQRLARSVRVVQWKAARLGLAATRREWTAQEVQQLRRCWLRGGSVRALAARIWRSEGAIYERARVLELPPKVRQRRAAA